MFNKRKMKLEDKAMNTTSSNQSFHISKEIKDALNDLYLENLRLERRLKLLCTPLYQILIKNLNKDSK